VLVPHTGKAVDGFCPGVVQTCCADKAEQTKKRKAVRKPLITASINFRNRGNKYPDSVFAGLKENGNVESCQITRSLRLQDKTWFC
jgi:hypothetical protein